VKKSTLVAVLLFCLALVLLVWAVWHFQAALIYFPRSYSDAEYQPVLSGAVGRLEFRTSQGPQEAYFVGTPSKLRSGSLWVLFHGNGSVALDWLDLLHDLDPGNGAFLLVEYPSYGRNGGKPSPSSIRENAEQALQAFCDRFRIKVSEFRLNVLGYSLGGGAALDFAKRHPVDRVILVGTFTSTSDLAGERLGLPLGFLLVHRFDNRQALRMLREKPSSVIVIHGATDQVIPVRMARELATAYPEITRLIVLPECHHNAYFGKYREVLLGALRAGKNGVME
jgi:uncharacterized protein